MQERSKLESRRVWAFMLALALVWYGNGNGAAFVESFVNYPSWHLIGSAEFAAYHLFITPRVIAFLVAPALLGTLFSFALIWLRPSGVPAWAVWAVVLAQGVLWAATAGIQIPIQIALRENGFSAELMDRLITTNFWLRRIPYAVCAGLYLWMAVRLIGAATQQRDR